VELGWGLEARPMLSADGGRLSVMCPGLEGRKNVEALPREFVTVDVAAGKVLSRAALPRPADASFATPDGKTGVVLSKRVDKKNAAQPAELRLVDLATGTVAAPLALEGAPDNPVLSFDRQFVYLLDPGKPNGNPDKNVNGRLHVASLAAKTVTVSDAGSNPRGLVLDESGKRFLLLSDGQPFKGPGNNERPGELRVIAGAAPAAPIKVIPAPALVQASPDGKTLYLMGGAMLQPLALPGLAPGPPVKIAGIGWGDTQRIFNPDGKRVHVLRGGENVATHDLATGAEIADVKTGRTSKKLWLGVQSAVKTEAERSRAEQQAIDNGQSYYTYSVYTVRPAEGSMVLREDGKVLYALNSMTDDVTVVSAETGQLIGKVAVGGFALRMLAGAPVALAVSSGKLQLIDLATHAKQPDLLEDGSAGFDDVHVAPNGRLAVVQGTGQVYVARVDGGRLVGAGTPFKKVVDVEVDWGRPASR
jgi:DNA-binding beta-propeller fold protein YncE